MIMAPDFKDDKIFLSAKPLFCGNRCFQDQLCIGQKPDAFRSKRNIFARALKQFHIQFFFQLSTAGLVTRMTTDVTNVQNAFQMIIRIAVRAPLMLIFSMAMCFMINRSLSFVFLAAIRVVKAYVREDHENKKFSRAAQNLYRLFVKAESMLALNNPVMMLVVYACLTAVSWFGAHFIVAGSMSTGDITSLFSYVMSVMMSLMMLSMIFVMVTMSSASVRRISEVLKEQPELHNPVEPVMEVADGSIDFDHVSFAYKHGTGEDTLEDIDLHIKSGETIGIIGGTGCGKSSLVSLISRLYDASCGTVRVGGRDVRDYDMEVLRNEVAVVLQKNVLFSGTILDNLRWGMEAST